MKFKITFLYLMLLLFFGNNSYAQCNVNSFTATPTNGTCFANGSISVQVPGAVNCTNWIAVLTPSSGPVQQLPIPANGGPVIFNSLSAGNYNISLVNGGTVIQAPNNPIAITTTYINMSVSSSHTITTCNPAATNYVNNATLTATVAAGTGTGPFVYTCPGATNSPSAPTMSRSYVFTGLAAGTYNFSVTDQVNGQAGCEVTVGQTRVIPANTNPLLNFSNVRYLRVGCPTFCNQFVLYFPFTNYTNVTSATISINGGASQPLGAYQTFVSQFVWGFPSPTMTVGDTYVATFTDGCDVRVVSGTVPPVSTIQTYIDPRTSIASCSVGYSIHFEFFNSNGNTKFCLSNTQVTVSGVGTFTPLSTGYLDVTVPGPGTYNINITDGCSTETRTIIVNNAAPNVNLVTISTMQTLRENTGGMFFNYPNSSNLQLPFTYSIMPADGSTSRIFTSTHPYNLAGTFTVNFPIVRTVNSTNPIDNAKLVRDLPIGLYNVTFTDACGNTITRSVNINVPATYNPVITVNQGCNNSSSATYNLNAPNNASLNGVFDAGVVRLFTNVGGLPGTLITTLYPDSGISSNGYKSGTFTNLSTGNYLIVIDRTKFVGMWGYSAVTGLTNFETYYIPFTVNPYQDITVSTESALCDINDTNTGVVLAQITGGTAVYPLTWQLFSVSNPTVPLQTFTANTAADANALEQSFTGLAAGDYFVRTSNSCYSVDTNVTVNGIQVIPQANTSQSVVCPGSNTVTLSVNASEDLYDIVWTDDLGNVVGTGDSVTVTINQTTTYTATLELLTVFNCVNSTPFTSQITVTYTPAPNLNLAVNDIDLCQLQSNPATIVISNSEVGFTYEILDGSSNPLVPSVSGIGNGGNLTLTIPNAQVPTAGTQYSVSVTNGNPSCSSTLTETILFFEGTPVINNTVVGSTVCLNLDGTITINNSVNSATYTIYQSGSPLTPSISGIGNNGDLILTIPASQLVTGTNTFDIQISGSGCTTSFLTNQAQIIVLSTIAQIGTTQTTCDVGGTSYVVTATFSGNAPFTAIGTGTPGTWVDNGNGTHTWTSASIATNVDYNIDFEDSNSCNTINLTAVAPTCIVDADLSVTKVVNNATPNVGGVVTFTITATNNGPSDATNVVVTDVIPSGYTIALPTDIVPSTGTWTAPNWTIGNLANGVSATLTITATVNPTGPYDNTATIDGNENDPDPSDDSDTEVVTLNNYTYAIDDINTSLINTPVTGNVLTNDFDLEGNTQTIASNTNPSNGTVVMNPDGTYTYTPNSGFTGTDSFTYTVCDNGTPIACSTATVTINVEEILISSGNNDLVANNDAVITENGTTITIAVLSNDFDPDNNTFVITPGSVTDPANGTVVVNPDGTITYTPDPGYEGEDTFTYQICDNGSPVSCETATVIVTVLPNSSSNTTYAIDDSYFINCSSNSTMNLLDNDYDLESDLQTINTTPVVQPLHGTVTINTDGTFNYTANPCYAGPDSFVYQVCDNGSPQACDVATVYLLIQDTTAPTGTAPADITGLQCIADVPVADVNAITDEADNCLGAVTVTVADTNNGGTGCLGSPYIVTRTYTLADTCGNTTDLVQTITVEDTIAPTGTAPADITGLQCIADVPVADVNAITDEADNCLGAVTVTVADTNNGGTGCLGSPYIVTRTYTLADACGNTTDLVQTITVEDTTAPTGIAPADITGLQCIADVPLADVNAITDEADNCLGAVTVSVADTNNGGTGCLGSPYIVTRTYTLADACGNTTDLVQTITVEDTTAPTFVESLPADLVLECTDVVPTAPVLTAIDNCSTATVIYNEQRINGSCASNYQLIRTWTANDTCGNETSHIQIIDVQDTTPPVFTGELPVDGFADCDNIPVAPTMTATDNCGNVTVTLDEQRIDGDCSSRYLLIRTWTATDDCGNSSTYTQTITLACHIKIWNAVSPDGDTKNDIFYLEGIECYPNNNVEIFNRWGVKVYETSNYDNINNVFKGYSDGRSTISRNEKLPTGTYFYIIKYEYSYDGVNGKQMINKTGHLYIQNN